MSPRTTAAIDVAPVLDLARQAAAEILDVYRRDFAVETKADNSPLTEADVRSNRVIVEGLKALYPEIPVLAEESRQIPYEERRHWERFWLVDPLDGTKEFVKKNGEFTINIALVEKCDRSEKSGADYLPVLGVLYAPVPETAYTARLGAGAFKQQGDKPPQAIRATDLNGKSQLVVAGSRSHRSEAMEVYVTEKRREHDEVTFISAGSALKFGLVAEGKADVYPRFGPTMEWDTAAGHIIVKESGRQVISIETGGELSYNKPELKNGHFICR